MRCKRILTIPTISRFLLHTRLRKKIIDWFFNREMPCCQEIAEVADTFLKVAFFSHTVKQQALGMHTQKYRSGRDAIAATVFGEIGIPYSRRSDTFRTHTIVWGYLLGPSKHLEIWLLKHFHSSRPYLVSSCLHFLPTVLKIGTCIFSFLRP